MELILRTITGLSLALLIALLYFFAPAFIFSLFLILCALWLLIFEWRPLATTLQTLLAAFSFLYIAGGFGLLIFMNVHLATRQAILLIFLLSFIHDTAAYCTGRLMGRHKLWPAVSPGKTWEGFIGGVMAAVVFVIIATKASCFKSFMGGASTGALLLFAGGAAVCATAGDLFESFLKRKAGVKDSGTLLPGHGGLFDRFDSILAITWWIYFWNNNFFFFLA